MYSVYMYSRHGLGVERKSAIEKQDRVRYTEIEGMNRQSSEGARDYNC